MKPKLTTQLLHSQLKWEHSHRPRGRATILPYTQATRKVIVYMTGEISGLSPEHSDHTEPAQGLWGLEPLFLKHFTQPLACSKSPGKASAFFFFFKSYHMSSIASSSPFQYLKGLRTVVHVSSDFAIKGTRGFYKFSESSTLYIFLDTLSLQISFCFYDLSCL